MITEQAIADLIEIGDFIRQHNAKRAIAFIDELLDRCESLVDMPYAFAIVPRYKKQAIRRCIHQNYLIFYTINQDVVEIIHILHGARNYETLLDK
jgi:addiction module RelE/StbE family toxin